MNKRDIVLSLCSLLLGVTLGASSIMYAQGVPTKALQNRGQYQFQTVKHKAPAKAAKYTRRYLRTEEKNAMKATRGTQQ